LASTQGKIQIAYIKASLFGDNKKLLFMRRIIEFLIQ
jgi:hypothetical protein